jgi:LmbE family N-acetylglucosaminyl deacetylase
MKKYLFIVVIIFFFCFSANAQKPEKLNSSEIFNKIQKLNFLGSVLYIAAHPDDENTKLISFFANEKKARTGYLSLTRGDGGQNLIGSELRELLGTIRTQELIEARKIDGGNQFFSRANDFGFSKNPEETLTIWDRNEVLSDVVYIIRKFQPDVIINRFDHRTSGTTHGHHTASAQLSVEAFDKVNDANAFTNQLKWVQTWKPKRLFFNTSWWFYGSKEKFEAADKSNLLNLKTGVYYQNIGKSNQEIAALSRSCHQSQGFGNTGTRGEEEEYLELLKGEMPSNTSNIFEGIDTTWNRVKGGAEIGIILTNVEKNFDFKNPSSSIPELVKAYQLIHNLENEHWKTIKLEEIKAIIASCSGLYLEAVSESQEVNPNSILKVKTEIINRSLIKMNLKSIETFSPILKSIEPKELVFNKNNSDAIEFELPKNIDYTSPYWLNQKGTVGMYRVDEQNKIGIPDVIRQLEVTFNIEIEGVTISFERNIVFKTNDNVKGEIYQPLDIVPEITSSFAEKVYVFNNNRTKTIAVKIKSGKDNIAGKVRLEIPKNWEISPLENPFKMERKGEEQIVIFSVKPSKETSENVIKSIVTIDNQEFDKNKIDINYNHIFKQMVLKPAETKFLKLNIKTKNEKIAYIMGAGDEVPKSLQQMGYEVSIINPNEISTEKLSRFDVVMTGIRAYNVVNELKYKQDILLNFVKNGKTMIVQYNTTDALVTPNIAPFPLKIGKERVTEENAEVRFIDQKNEILNFPNKLTIKDFEGWTQEQGLNYPSEFDNNFVSIISSNDKGETPKNSAILVAKYGKGTYIYTGISFFRQLPEGVSGAFRLMSNLISVKN